MGKDDLVYILYGCNVLIIVRQYFKDRYENAVGGQARSNLGPGEEETFYELLGACYVHGSIDGEVIQFQDENFIISEIFELR